MFYYLNVFIVNCELIIFEEWSDGYLGLEIDEGRYVRRFFLRIVFFLTLVPEHMECALI